MDCNALRLSKYTKDVQFLFENLFLKKKILLPESRYFARENAVCRNEDHIYICIYI